MIKAAVYCRVSTDKEDQANSFSSQQKFFRQYIEQHSDWELYGVYADEGITGTSTKKRVQFNRMIEDAYNGKFQLIITKEVSRFSRNILDTIAYTRDLRSIGVAVLFAADGIHTMEPDAELRLSIMASLAQEESRRTSSRVTWGQTRQMENGVVFGKSLLGYDVKAGKLYINPEGAEIVKLIFQKYAEEHMGATEIAKFLTEKGYHTRAGNSQWRSNTIIKILSNEKYVGDLVQKKSYTPDYLTHAKRRNTGEVPLIRIEHHHEPIIRRDIWNQAQERLKRNDKHKAEKCGHSNRYIFSGKIKCGLCGAAFVGRTKTLADGTCVRRWSCGTAVREGAAICSIGRLVRDDDARQMLKTAMQSLQINGEEIAGNVTALAMDAIQAGEHGQINTREQLLCEMERTRFKIEAVMDSCFSGDITKEEMKAMKHKYDQKLKELQKRIALAEEQTTEKKNSEQLRTAIQAEITALLNCEAENEILYKNLLQSLTVFKDRYMELKLNHLPQVFRFTD